MTEHLVDALLGFGVVVVVPLGLPLVGAGEFTSRARVTGVLACISFFLPAGVIAGLVALPWLVVVAALAMGRLRVSPPIDLPALLSLIPVLYLVVGAGWFVLARYGRINFGFGPRIVELAAVHFHYAGFVTSVMLLQLVRWLKSRRVRALWLGRLAYGAVVVGTPLTAAGITFAPIFGAIGASFLALGVVIGCVLTLGSVARSVQRGASSLLTVSALGIVGTIALAVAYSFGQWLGTPAPSIATMAWSHGILNAFAFALCGLLGWRAVVAPCD